MARFLRSTAQSKLRPPPVVGESIQFRPLSINTVEINPRVPRSVVYRLGRVLPSAVTTQFGQIVLATFFDTTVVGDRTAFASTSINTDFSNVVAGTKWFFGATSINTDFGMTAAATKWFFGEVAINTDFGIAAQANLTGFASIVLNVDFGISAFPAGGVVSAGRRPGEIPKEVYERMRKRETSFPKKPPPRRRD